MCSVERRDIEGDTIRPRDITTLRNDISLVVSTDENLRRVREIPNAHHEEVLPYRTGNYKGGEKKREEEDATKERQNKRN